jgi:hypothetical protein
MGTCSANPLGNSAHFPCAVGAWVKESSESPLSGSCPTGPISPRSRPTDVGVGDAVDNHHNVKQCDFAFMHDASGNHIFWDWNLDGQMDVASPRSEIVPHQDHFYDRALASVSQGGFDGLLIDDVWSSEGVQRTPDAVEYSNADNHEALQASLHPPPPQRSGVLLWRHPRDSLEHAVEL